MKIHCALHNKTHDAGHWCKDFSVRSMMSKWTLGTYIPCCGACRQGVSAQAANVEEKGKWPK